MRGVGMTSLDVYIENSGEFVVDGAAVVSVHDAKVILDVKLVEARLRHAIEHAHDREDEATKR